jgi:hypothetical protein
MDLETRDRLKLKDLETLQTNRLLTMLNHEKVTLKSQWKAMCLELEIRLRRSRANRLASLQNLLK